MSVHRSLPLCMGALMGAVMASMVASGAMAQAGAGFVLGHVAVLVVLIGLSAIVPRIRHALRAHLTERAMWQRMATGMALGVAGALLFRWIV